MRIKELANKIAHVAWSPSPIYPAYIVSGTAAQQLDSSFSTNATLDVLKLDLSNPSTELESCGSIVAESRFNKLLWSEHSSSHGARDVIVAGCENSKVYLYDYEKVLGAGGKATVEPLVRLEKHSGPVAALDINPFQHNLLASGSSASEILIWDLNNPSVPMTPGAKIQPLDDINCIAWNHQVQHILASTCSGKCVVWDLRKNESIIKVSDNISNMKAKVVAWHPEVATQMCLSSEDDHTPFLQLWDLRFATSPVRTLEGHQRGILAFTWCTADSNLLVSSAKDNRILCWNPNNATSTTGEIVYELPTSGQWCFDISWCKRSPDLICASSYEGQINVYSLMGGKYNVNHQTSNKIMDSFGDTSSTPSSPNLVAQNQSTHVVQQLKFAPKWMKRPCRANFAFGGKLASFGHYSATDLGTAPEQQQQQQQVLNQRVTVYQVVTDNQLVERSHQLEGTLQSGQIDEYCARKIETADSDHQKQIWKFIMATFDQNKNDKFLGLLGFGPSHFEKLISPEKRNGGGSHSLNNSHNGVDAFGLDALNLNGKVNGNKPSEADTDNQSVFDEITRSQSPIDFSFDSETDNQLSQQLMLGNYDQVVELCMRENRFAEATLIASFFDHELLIKVQKAYFKNNRQSKFAQFLESILNRDWHHIAANCNLDDWKEALATLITYTSDQELHVLSEKIAKRLEDKACEHAGQKDGQYQSYLTYACICYICSSNIENLVSCWQKLVAKLSESSQELKGSHSATLQDLIEKVMILRYSLQNRHAESTRKIDQSQSYVKLNKKLIEYAKLLADQGCFLNALNYMNDSNDPSILIMKDRLFNVIDPMVVQQYRLKKPDCPFKAHQQAYAKIRPSHGSQSQVNPAAVPVSSIPATRKTSYHTVQDPSLSGGYAHPPAPTPASYYNPVAAAPVQPPMPAYTGPVNHPMAPALISAAVATTAAYAAAPSIPNIGPPPVASQMYQPKNPTPQPPPPAIFNPGTNSAIQPPSQTPTMPQLQSFMHTKPATAWNDPPMVQPKIKSTPAPVSVEASLPSNIYQPTAPTNIANYYQPNMSATPAPPIYSAVSPSPLPANVYQPQPPRPLVDNSALQQQQHQQPPQPAAPQEKLPIPVEHQIIQQVFDTLLSKCMMATNVVQMRKKLDDVTKKLDVLYDKLRDLSLSASVIQGVHTIVQYIQASDYQSALVIHSQIVAMSNFTEISGFMPGIKVLIQSCQQLNVSLLRN